MEENFKKETDLLFSIEKNMDHDKVLKDIFDFGIDTPFKEGTSLYFSVIYNRFEIVKILISKGANIDALYDKEYSPLMAAVNRDNIEMVKLLINNGANINLVDKHGNGALWKAVFNNNLEIVKLLVNAGADPFKEIKDGWNIYDGAKHMGLGEIIDFFDTLKK